MEEIRTRKQFNKQKKYRRTQQNKGVVRFEIQVDANTKARFDEMVEAVADEYIEPFDLRRRNAKARAQVFREITQNVTHEFFTLKDKIKALKEQITALTPSFFKTNTIEKTLIPDAISALPDDPQHLKSLLAKIYNEGQQAKLAATEFKRRADQFSELHELSQIQNDEYRKKLKETGLLSEEF
jgi:hypothetical protein